MRFRCRIENGFEVGAAPMSVARACCAPVEPMQVRAPAVVRRRRQWPMHSAVAGAVALALAGCATRPANVAKAWKVEPVFDVHHAGQSSASYVTLGQYHEGARDWGKAVDAYGKAIKVDPANADAHNALGIALARTGRVAEAEAPLRRAVELAPSRPHLRNNLGYVLLLAGKPAEAVPVLQASLAQDGSSAAARANLRDATERVAAADAAGASAKVMAAATPTPASAQAAPSAAPVRAESVAAVVAGVPNEGIRQPLTPSLATAVQAAPAFASSVKAPAMQVGYEPTVPALERVVASAQLSGAGLPRAESLARAALPLAATTTPLDPVMAAPVPTFSKTGSPQKPAQTSSLEISNGNGVPGMAARVGRWLATQGVQTTRVSNQPRYLQQQTVVQYRAGFEGAAQRVASSLPAGAATQAQPTAGLRTDVQVVLGRDWVRTASCLGQNTCRPPATTLASAELR